MGHVLMQSCMHDYKSIDFWGALASTAEIAQFNWCEYVVQCLLDPVTWLKIDIEDCVTIANLTGGHLFLQVFYLDNIDLGIFNMKHDVLPRVKEFDQDKIASDDYYGNRSWSTRAVVCFITGNGNISHLYSPTFLGGETLSPYLSLCSMNAICFENML